MAKKKNKKGEPETTGSSNRRTMNLDVKKIKKEIEESRVKKAEAEAIAHAEAEAAGVDDGDLRLFKPKEEPSEEPGQKSKAKKSGSTKADTAKDEKESADSAEDGEKQPYAYEAPDPAGPARQNLDIIEVEQEPTRWQKFLGTGKRRNYILGFGVVLPVVLVFAYLFYITLGWREWSGNLVILSIPVLVALTYVFDHYAQPEFWEEYAHIKILRYENRQDAAVILPLILFMGVLSLNSDMFFLDGVIHYFRFVILAVLVWSSLIWLTRRVPPPRVRK